MFATSSLLDSEFLVYDIEVYVTDGKHSVGPQLLNIQIKGMENLNVKKSKVESHIVSYVNYILHNLTLYTAYTF